MSLTTYKEKRNFRISPEPKSGKKKGKTSLSFVVQRHDATRIHYDFRLEMEGVLKSWAIPKGPSMIAGDKRLAVMVEDHPFEYRKFYGEIPQGTYGAGIVEILDSGSYKLMKPSDNPEKELIRMLEKGDLKFILEGTYLKGAFALVRINDQEGKNWLLIKKKDEFALQDFDIEKLQPLKSKRIKKMKVKNPGTLPRSKQTKTVISEPFPGNKIKPMLARLSKKIIDNPEWIYETKYDGYRLIAKIYDHQVELWTRNGINVTKTYETVAAELAKSDDDVILDGEVLIENNRKLSDFQALQNYTTTRKGNLKYYIFDLLFLNGHNTMDLPLSDRKDLLESYFENYRFRHVFKTKYQKGNGKKIYEKLASKGYEGVIAKDPGSKYYPGARTDSWLKVKNVNSQEAVICGYTAPQKSRMFFGSLILGIYDENRLKYIGNVGTGFTEASLEELHGRLEKLKTAESPFNPPQKMTGMKGKPSWVKPELVASIKFSEWTQDGHLRHPVFLGLRTDKKAAEVIDERRNMLSDEHSPAAGKISSTAPAKKEKPAPAKKVTEEKVISAAKDPENEKTVKINGRELKLTNLQKIYWPSDQYKKGDLVSYYREVSKFILPYLKNRPQSLNRHPNGIKGQSFYQKDMNVDQIPSWLHTERIYSKSNDDYIDYLICNDEATLTFMANLGCIELNPWHSTYQTPDNPDYVMLDLDPGNTPFSDVVDAALVIKEICDEISISGYCKTSGATGLHIYFPLAAKYDYDEGKTFAEILAVIANNRLPDKTSIERVVAKRNDKVYIDFLQNRKGQTIAAPYSVRPRDHATVSAPLRWDEVNYQLSPENFTIKNLPERLAKKGDLWEAVLKKGIQLPKALKAIEKLS